MTLNYECLGSNNKLRERRYTVLSYFIRGATPQEIAAITELNNKDKTITIKQVYNDIAYLRTHELHDLPLNMLRDLNTSFYELKVTELERKLKKHESNPSVWLGIQKLIIDVKDKSLKLQGAAVEKVEHSGYVKLYDFSTDKYPDPEPASETT